MSGVLYGVGVGPGAPDLLTLRAVNVLRAADVLALPRSSAWGASIAWSILEPVLGRIPGQERLFLTFPMTYDADKARAAHAAAWDAIAPHLQQGRTVAFATEGDPSLYSTFIDMQRAAAQRLPAVRVEIVPGVCSVNAVAGLAGVPLADGAQRIAIIPAAHGVKDLEQVLQAFDTTVLMKIGPNMSEVIAAIERLGLLDRAVYVSRGTMAEQRVVRDVREIRELRGDCFAMLIVARGEGDARHAVETGP
jgi:precorrin-2/cobalt-factor-2 C20-methyltransferase